MDASIIIVNYNTADLVAECIRSVFKFTEGLSYEVIVVDNASGDGCGDTLRREFPGAGNIRFVQLDANLGFGMANNEGFRVAVGRNLLCLNPDTLLLNNAVKILSDFLDSHADVGACGGNLYDEHMRPAQSFFRNLPSLAWDLSLLTFRKVEKLVYRGSVMFNHTGRPIDVGYITGADLMVKRGVIDEVGGFSPDFFMYYEETDLCCRVRRAGYRVVSVPQAEIQHLEGKSFGRGHAVVNERKIRMAEESRLVYYKRNVGRMETRLANIAYGLSLALSKAAFRLAGRDLWRYYDCRQRVFRELRRQEKRR